LERRRTTITVSRLFESYDAAERAMRDPEAEEENRDDIRIIAGNTDG